MRPSLYTTNFSKTHQPFIYILMVQQPPVSHGPLIIEASQSHSDTPHSVGLLWTGDQPDTQHSKETDIQSPAGFEQKIPASERPKTHALERETTGIGTFLYAYIKYTSQCGRTITRLA